MNALTVVAVIAGLPAVLAGFMLGWEAQSYHTRELIAVERDRAWLASSDPSPEACALAAWRALETEQAVAR